MQPWSEINLGEVVIQDDSEASEIEAPSQVIYYRKAIGDDPGIQDRDYPAHTYVEREPLYRPCLYTGEMIPFYPGSGWPDR